MPNGEKPDQTEPGLVESNNGTIIPIFRNPIDKKLTIIISGVSSIFILIAILFVILICRRFTSKKKSEKILRNSNYNSSKLKKLNDDRDEENSIYHRNHHQQLLMCNTSNTPNPNEHISQSNQSHHIVCSNPSTRHTTGILWVYLRKDESDI